jgi:hypothetical protein
MFVWLHFVAGYGNTCTIFTALYYSSKVTDEFIAEYALY